LLLLSQSFISILSYLIRKMEPHTDALLPVEVGTQGNNDHWLLKRQSGVLEHRDAVLIFCIVDRHEYNDNSSIIDGSSHVFCWLLLRGVRKPAKLERRRLNLSLYLKLWLEFCHVLTHKRHHGPPPPTHPPQSKLWASLLSLYSKEKKLMSKDTNKIF